jgi:hypothetical protein
MFVQSVSGKDEIGSIEASENLYLFALENA